MNWWRRATASSSSSSIRNGLDLFSPLPTVISFFFKLSKAILGSTEPIFTIFSPNGIRYLCECCQSGPVFLFLNGRCRGNQFWAKLVTRPLFSTLAFKNGLECHNMDKQLYSANDPNIVYKLRELWSSNARD